MRSGTPFFPFKGLSRFRPIQYSDFTDQIFVGVGANTGEINGNIIISILCVLRGGTAQLQIPVLPTFYIYKLIYYKKKGNTFFKKGLRSDLRFTITML